MVRMTVSSLEKIHATRAKLDKEEKLVLSRTHDKALAHIVKIARESSLSPEQIMQALGAKIKLTKVSTSVNNSASQKLVGKNKLAGKKIPAKFRNPSDAKQTWTGREKMPTWVKVLHDKGQLNSAEIKP